DSDRLVPLNSGSCPEESRMISRIRPSSAASVALAILTGIFHFACGESDSGHAESAGGTGSTNATTGANSSSNASTGASSGTATGSGDGGPCGNGATVLFATVKPIFAQNCALGGCHDAATARGALDLQTDPYTSLVGRPTDMCATKSYVTPCDVARS